MFVEIIVIFMTSHTVVETCRDFLHGGGAQFGEIAGPLRPQVHRGLSAMESASVKDCVGRCSQVQREYVFGECVVDMHELPIKGTANVKFKVLDGIEPTLSMPMLAANGNRVILADEC